MVRPATSTTAMPMRVTSAQRRPITSDRHSLRAQPRLHVIADLGETLRRASLEAEHEDGLRVRCPDQSPGVAEEHAHTVDVDDVVRRAKMGNGTVDDAELDLLGAVNADLRSRDELRNVRQQLG